MKTYACTMSARPEGALGIKTERFDVIVAAVDRHEAVKLAAVACHEAGKEPGVIFVQEVRP